MSEATQTDTASPADTQPAGYLRGTPVQIIGGEYAGLRGLIGSPVRAGGGAITGYEVRLSADESVRVSIPADLLLPPKHVTFTEEMQLELLLRPCPAFRAQEQGGRHALNVALVSDSRAGYRGAGVQCDWCAAQATLAQDELIALILEKLVTSGKLPHFPAGW